MTPKPVKPVRCYAIVNAKGRYEAVLKKRKTCVRWASAGERIIRGRFVPDAPTKKVRKR